MIPGTSRRSIRPAPLILLDPPGPPTDASVDPVTITITWDVPTYPGGSPISGYLIWSEGDANGHQAEVVMGSNVFVVEGYYTLLPAGDTYKVYVAATNNDGAGPPALAGTVTI